MTVPNKSLVINTLSEEYGCSLKPYRGKQIIFEGIIGKESLIVCTPSSKLHVRGHGWFDLTIKQVEILDSADKSVLAIRLPNKVYYLDFKELRKLMTEKAIHNNPKEGKHWKFYVWNNHIEVRGSKEQFIVEPKELTA
jgi:hypothetical protein